MRHEINPIEVEDRKAYQDWQELQSGDAVYVAHPHFGKFSAVVDDKTSDSRHLWIVRKDSGTRHVFEHREGISIVMERTPSRL